MSAFENLKIVRLIIHEIFSRDSTNRPKPAVHGLSLWDIPAGGKDTLQQRLVTALSSNAHSIEMDIVDNSQGSVSEIALRSIASADADFIADSRLCADKLALAQTSRSVPGGVVVVISGKMGIPALGYCMVMKAEVHAGFSKRADGSTITADYLSELFLTPQQKLYKIGVFIEPHGQYGPRAFVYDHNMSRSETRPAAKYFYESFLGCKVADSSKLLTQAFFLDSRDFINSLALEPEEKIDLQDQLNSYLKNPVTATIDTHTFADSFLPVSNQDDYYAYMAGRGFPATAVVKDNELIKGKLKRRSMNFSSGIRVSRKDGNLAEYVKVESSTETETVLKIMGKLESQVT